MDVAVLRMRAVGLEGARGVGGFRARARPPGGPTWDLGRRGGDRLGLEHPATSVCGAEPIPRSGCREVAIGRKEASSPAPLSGSSSETL